jgi:hypothetical protein
MPAHALALAHEARAEHVVGAPAGDGLEHALEVGREVLAVAVEVDGGGVAVVAGDGQPGSQGRAEAARGLMRDDASALLAPDPGGGVARAIVYEQEVDRHAAGTGRDACEDRADGGLLVASDDDGEAAPGGEVARGQGLRVPNRNQRTAARRGRSLHPEQVGDRDGKLADRARPGVDRAGNGPNAPDQERHRPLAPVEVAVTADPAPLPVVGHQDDGRVLELGALIEEREEIAHVAVGLGELV